MDSQDEERLVRLETKLAYLEDFVAQIQQVAVSHTQELERLATENRLLAQKVKELADAAEGDIPNRRPPHY